MIHFAIGTKAQFIKMAPIMHLLQVESEPYHLLDLSQHGSLTGKILSDFRLKPAITSLGKTNQSVTTYVEAIRWFAHGLWQIVLHRRNLREKLFMGKNGVVLLHGDTLSTLLGLYLAKTAGLKTALVEAGLSSGNLLDPFPEEWVRRHVGKRVDFLFPPDAASEAWLRKRQVQHHIINTRYNTGLDSLMLITEIQAADAKRLEEVKPYGVVTLHRLETVSNRRRLSRVIRHILSLVEKLGPVRFYLHPPTEHALKRSGLIEDLAASSGIELRHLEPYPQFMKSLMESRFVLTDGGSIQEEASYLKKPCLVLRNRTERNEGIGQNAMLSTWDAASDLAFLAEKIGKNTVAINGATAMHASRTILGTLDEFRSCHQSNKA